MGEGSAKSIAAAKVISGSHRRVCFGNALRHSLLRTLLSFIDVKVYQSYVSIWAKAILSQGSPALRMVRAQEFGPIRSIYAKEESEP